MAAAAVLPLPAHSIRVSTCSEGRCKAVGYRVASWLTEPAVKTRELYYRVKIVDDLNPLMKKTSKYAEKFFLLLKMCGCALLALITTLPGIAIRSAISSIEKEPYIYFRSDHQNAGNKVLSNSEFTHLNWNICATSGGYAITDGGLVPWQFRMDRIAEKILMTDADIASLFEVFDFEAAIELYRKLKSKYTHFYFNIGAHGLGPNSGIFVASKFEIKDPKFTPYSKDTLTTRTKYANKGIFEFDLLSNHQKFAHFIDTHLQHSEIPSMPTEEEKKGRKAQMEVIKNKVNEKSELVVVSGDLNMDDPEFESLNTDSQLYEGARFYNDKATWDGDHYCKTLMKEPFSASQNLDHTAIKSGFGKSIENSLIETEFNASLISLNALSDHRGLLSKIKV